MKYEKWSLGYWLFKKYVIFADRLVHNRIVITGKENLPKNKPVLFSPNHQNALSDPLAILLNTPFQPVWLARADIFGRSKLTDGLLKFFKIMPVYRMRDGKENLTKNDKTFTDSVKVLTNNSALGLFPEAAHSRKRQMMMHKKAVPRIVFMAEEMTDFQLDIQIIPTGIYYSHYWKFGRTLIVNFGKPIAVSQYFEMYRQNPLGAVFALQKDILEAMLPLSLDIKSKTFYADFENIRELYGKEFLQRQNKPFNPLELFKSDQKLCAQLDHLEKTEPENTATLVADTKNYLSLLDKYRIRDWVCNPRLNKSLSLFGYLFLLLLGLPVFIFGFIFNAIPFFVVDKLIRNKIKDQSFWSSFFFVAGIIAFPVFYLTVFLIFSWLIPVWWIKILFIVSFPITGKVAFMWFKFFRKTIGLCKIIWLKISDKPGYNRLNDTRKHLFDQYNSLLNI